MGPVKFPHGLLVIDDYAFYTCTNLYGTLAIPNSVTTLGDSAFFTTHVNTPNPAVLPYTSVTSGSNGAIAYSTNTYSWYTSPDPSNVMFSGGALLAVDNCFASPALQRPIEFGADIIMHSGTKFLDGQGRVMAGALCTTQALINDKLLPVMKNSGMVLSPFNAWVVLKGLETLDIRMRAQSATALALAQCSWFLHLSIFGS